MDEATIEPTGEILEHSERGVTQQVTCKADFSDNNSDTGKYVWTEKCQSDIPAGGK